MCACIHTLVCQLFVSTCVCVCVCVCVSVHVCEYLLVCELFSFHLGDYEDRKDPQLLRHMAGITG